MVSQSTSLSQSTIRMMVAMFNNSGAEFYKDGRFDDAMKLFKEARLTQCKHNATNSQNMTRECVMDGHEEEEETSNSAHDKPGFHGLNASNRPQQRQRRDIAHGMYHEEKEDDLGIEYYDKPFTISMDSDIHSGFDSSVLLYNMGIACRSLGDVDKAVDYFERCLSLLPQSNISFEPLAIAALNNVGAIHYENGMYDEAMCDFIQAVRCCSDMPTADVDDSIASAEEIDCSPRASKRPRLSTNPAKNTKEFTLEEKWLLYQATTLNNIGRVDFHSNQFDDALTSCEAAVSIRNKILGPNHFDTVLIRYNIGLIAHKQGQLGVALSCYKEFVDIAVKVHGPCAAHVATALHQVSLIYSVKGKKDMALVVLEDVLSIRKKLHGEYHRDISKTYFSMGQFNLDLGKINEASTAFRESLRIAHVAFPEKHIIFVFAFCYMGQIHHLKGNGDDAVNSYEHALPIARSLFGNEHYLVINILNIIGNYWVEQGDLVAASSIFDEVSSIYVRSIIISGQLQLHQHRCPQVEAQANSRKCVKVVAKSA